MSVAVTDLTSGASVFAVDERIVLPTASVGKILLLIEVSARLTERSVSDFAIVDRDARDSVADSGLWQHLQAPAFPIGDLAALVGATSDNLATNVLLRQIGLPAIRARSEKLGLVRTALLDRVRDERGPDEAPQLSVGSATELAWLFHALTHGHIVNEETSQRVLGWLSLITFLSFVAASFGRDPSLPPGGSSTTRRMVNSRHRTPACVPRRRLACGPFRASVSYAVSAALRGHRS